MITATVNAGPRMDRLPVGKFHRRILCLIGAGMFFDSFDIYLAGAVLGALLHSGWSDMGMNATFISMTFVGMIIGSFAAAFLGDRFGRRFNFRFNLLIFALASLGAALSPTMEWLIGWRLIMGIGLAAEIVIGYATMTEFVPPAQRGRWGALLSLITNSALFASTLLGYVIVPTLGWRWMFGIAFAGSMVAWYFQRMLPESPRWLESAGRLEEAERCLQTIEAEVTADSGPLPAVQAVPPATEKHEPVKVWELFKPTVIRRTLLAMLLNIVINSVIYGFVAWVPSFLVKQGLSVSASIGYTVFMSLGGPVGAIFGIVLSDRLGRKRGIVIVSLIAAALGTAYAFATSQWMATAIGFALFTCIYLLVAFIYAAYVPELFPTEFRMRGAGLSTTVGRVSSVIVPYAVVSLHASGGITMVLTLLVGMLLVQAAVVATFGIETNKRSLEKLTPKHA
ncbi:MAG: MFS transporter [Rhodoplanes sp.]|uniref:MFS transporter n=1 Tax=Rhodoplanes sp. TaxID=1968906 RepID=UPI0017CA4F08|nr:MFS transporter [Rhodoplanes sp.]NVO16514.1 MFS transporter [Rhodoplanes sp.]